MPIAHPTTQSPPRSATTAKHAGDDADLEFDPTQPPLERVDPEPTLPPPVLVRPTLGSAIDLPPTLAPETPLPRCLTDAVRGSTRPAPPASEIPPAPKLPRFSLPAGRTAPVTDADRPPNSETCLGLPTDRVLPGSPALVSTFRPKPQLGACYSVTDSCREERLYAPKRPRKAKPPAKRRR